MRSLYEINADILACVDAETGEIDADKLDELLIERNDKIEAIALWVKNLTAEINMIKAEEKALADRCKAKESKVESLKKYLDSALSGQKFETAKVAVNFRKSSKVEITDFTKIPDDYLWKNERWDGGID